MAGFKRGSFLAKKATAVLSLIFFVNSVIPSPVFAQAVMQTILPASSSIGVTAGSFVPVHIKALKVRANEPLVFDFIIDSGSTGTQGEALKAETQKLAKYFLAAVTIPESDLWVNLSPYENDRIIPNELGITEMGREMLAQDSVLKQMSSAIVNPDTELGQIFWQKVYAKAQEVLGTTELPFDTMQKIWIIPSEAKIYEMNNTALLGESTLKVMLDQDYYALGLKEKPIDTEMNSIDAQQTREVSLQAMRDIILPAVEKEVNEGKEFASLRQLYGAMVFATWYKKALKESLLSQVYANQKKTAGVESGEASARERIYQEYVAAFKKGAFNFIREDADPVTGDIIPRKYFSGGVQFDDMAQKVQVTRVQTAREIPAAVQMPSTPTATETLVTFALKQPVNLRASFAKDAAMLPADRQRYEGDFTKAIQGYVDKAPELEGLLNEYQMIAKISAATPEQKAEKNKKLDALDKAINEIGDRLNVPLDVEQQVLALEEKQVKPLLTSQFKAMDGGKTFLEYSALAENFILNGHYVPELLFSGAATRLKMGPMYPINIWDIAVAMANEVKDATEENIKGMGKKYSPYSYGMGARQVIAYYLFIKDLAKKKGLDLKDVLKKQKIIMHLNSTSEEIAIKDLLEHNFYGFPVESFFFHTQPVFHGATVVNGKVQQDLTSGAMPFGNGEPLLALNQPGVFYQLDMNGQKVYLPETVLDRLEPQDRIVSHRINDLTKFLKDKVVGIDKLAMTLYKQQKEGFDLVLDLVSNPRKQKGGTPLYGVGLVEGLQYKGSPELKAIVEGLGEAGAAYNAFRISYPQVGRLKEVLTTDKLPAYFRFKDGYIYLETVTGDITQRGHLRTAYIQRDKKLIKDFKSRANILEAIDYLHRQDRELLDAGIMPDQVDFAMTLRDKAAQNGGIDLNAALLNMTVEKTGTGVKVMVDPMLIQQIKAQGVDGFMPVIINMMPITSVLPTMGLSEAPQGAKAVTAG